MMNRIDAGAMIEPMMHFLPRKMASDEALCMLLSIGHQESRFSYREQINGPAKGFWQFERAGIRGVFKHASSGKYARHAMDRLDLGGDVESIRDCLTYSGLTAAIIARLYLWTDPHPLPKIGDAEGAWECYLRTWRPGKPDRSRWYDAYRWATTGGS